MADCGELKKKRSYAQGFFTRRANTIDFNFDLLTELDLILELRALKGSYEDICNTSFDYIAVMEKGDASGFVLDIADVRKRLHECRTKYQDTEMRVKKTLWSRCASGQFGSLKTDLENVFDQAEMLQLGPKSHDQNDFVLTALESRVEALDEFVWGWDHYVPEKDVDVMRACLKDYKEKRRITIVALDNYMHQSGSHGDLGVLASGGEEEGDLDCGKGGVNSGGTTTADKPRGPSDGDRDSGMAHDDGAQVQALTGLHLWW